MAKMTVADSIAVRCAVAVRQSGVPREMSSQSANPASAVETVTISPATSASHQTVAVFSSLTPSLESGHRRRERVGTDRDVRQQRVQRVPGKPFSSHFMELPPGVDSVQQGPVAFSADS